MNKKWAILVVLIALCFLGGTLYAEMCYETGPFYYNYTYITLSQCPPYTPGAPNYCCGFRCEWSTFGNDIDIWYCMTPGACIQNSPYYRPCWYY